MNATLKSVIIYAAMLGVFALLIFTIGCGDSKQSDYLPKISEIQSKYDYTYYEAYTFAYRYALVKAALAKDKYWVPVYSKRWDKYAHNKGHSKRLAEDRFWKIMEHADRIAN